MTKIMRIGSSSAAFRSKRTTAQVQHYFPLLWTLLHGTYSIIAATCEKLIRRDAAWREKRLFRTLNKSKGIIFADVVVVVVVIIDGGGGVLWFESPSMWTRHWGRWFTLFFSFFLCGYIFTRYCHRNCGLWWTGYEPLYHMNNFCLLTSSVILSALK